MKTCKRCGLEKSLDNFYQNKGHTRSYCKVCTNKKNYAYQQRLKTWKMKATDSEKLREYHRTYRLQNKEKIREAMNRFKLKHPDYFKQYYRIRRNEG